MTYFNPRIYNYSNLKAEDKLIVRCILTTVDEIDAISYDYKEPLDEEEKVPLLKQIYCETATEVLDKAIAAVYRHAIDFIVCRIDDYEDDDIVKDCDTDDYFYGLTKTEE